MGENFWWNFTQMPGRRFMTEDDMRNIEHPATELGIHIAFKNYEAGSLIGGFLIAPLLPYIRPRGDLAKRKFRIRMGICGRRGMIVGLVATPLMEYGFIQAKKVDEDGLKDRCYRIRYNKKQLLVDRAVLLSSLLGFGAARWAGMVMGANVGLIGATAYNALLFDRLRHKRILGGDQMETPDPNYKERKL